MSDVAEARLGLRSIPWGHLERLFRRSGVRSTPPAVAVRGEIRVWTVSLSWPLALLSDVTSGGSGLSLEDIDVMLL